MHKSLILLLILFYSFLLLLSNHHVLSIQQEYEIKQIQRISNTNFMWFYNSASSSSSLLSINMISSINSLNNSLNNSSSMDYGGCNPILFELGNFSRDGPNLMYGICPDTWLTPAVSILFITCYLIALIGCGIGLFLKRKSAHVKARNISNLFMTILSNSGFIVMICLRFIIGRRIYPCSIYILSYFIIPPGVLLPSIFRLWRLYFLHQENLQKMKMNEFRKEDTITNINNTIISTTNIMNASMNASTSVATQTLKRKSCMISNTFSDIDTESTTDDTNSYWNDYELEFKKHEKKHKIFTFLLSNKFVLASYCISFCLHIFLFIILGSIEEGLYNRDPTKPRVFLGEGGFFVSTNGCVINNSIVIILAVETVFYIVVEIVFLILSFVVPNDTYYIKRETLILIVLQFFTIILFAICGFLKEISDFTDYFVPFGFVLMTYSFVEVIVCVLFPILYSNRKNHEERDSELEQFLMNKRTFSILLDFAKRSYCPESVLCYRDIEKFKLTSKKNRKKAALLITKTYLKPGSPLELNFPKLEQTFNEYSLLINNSNTILETSLFETIQLHCLIDMRDVFDRLKNQSKETRTILEEWRAATITPLQIMTLVNQEEFNSYEFTLQNIESIDLSTMNSNNQNNNNTTINITTINNTSMNNVVLNSSTPTLINEEETMKKNENEYNLDFI